MENDDHQPLKSEDQMEIIMMMQQMEKIPEFCSSYNDLSSPPSDFSASSSNDPHCLGNVAPSGGGAEQKQRSVAAMREMIFRMAVMQPIQIDPESVKAPKRRNVKISTDPQSVAARHRRERISERIRILQRLVPGGTKMDTASMLDEAIHYVKFLKTQVKSLRRAAAAANNSQITTAPHFPFEISTATTYVPIPPKQSPIMPHQFGDA